MKSAVLQLSQVALYFVSSQSHVFLGHFSSFTWKLRSIRIKIFKHTKHDMFKQKWNLRYSNLKRNSCLMHVMSQSCSSFTQSHNILLVKIRKRSNTSLRVSARRPRSVITASRSIYQGSYPKGRLEEFFGRLVVQKISQLSTTFDYQKNKEVLWESCWKECIKSRCSQIPIFGAPEQCLGWWPPSSLHEHYRYQHHSLESRQ